MLKIINKKIAQKNDKSQILKPIPPATPVEKEEKNEESPSNVPVVDSSPLEKPFDQMTEDEKDKPAHDIVMREFMFAQTLSCALSST